ncbi:MAG: class I SAM-dependent methyltransferase [Lachnospiraceae bacterium]|nr:class I SAM-dependent methyltransferase [Lachnospiraceae bacterium]
MAKISTIGNVKLDYTRYSGADLYTDGDIEKDLLDTAMNHSRSEFPAIIEKKRDFTYLYHFSHLRHNIAEWLPIGKEHKVLEIGSGCGAITGILSEKAKEVVCVDLSETRCKINAYRHQEKDNITIHIGNFNDIEPDLSNDYDFILFIGVFEYCCLYIESDEPDDVYRPYIKMLETVKQHLKNDGHLVIAIENRFGLKYWAGCTEDHLGTFFSGLEDYPDGGNARTFTRNRLEKILNSAGILDFNFYYPYPDYKFMTTLFSDARLPVKGELYDNMRNFDRHRMEIFNERKVFDSIIEEDSFPMFSNSYLVYTGKDTETAYLRYSNDRALEYRIKTEITKNFAVRKTALNNESYQHIKRINESYHLLSDELKESILAVNGCKLSHDGKCIDLEYVNGKTLAWHLDECLKKNDMARFDDYIERFEAIVRLYIAKAKSEMINHDLIFTNIIIEENVNKWTLLDYEWMLNQELTYKEMLYRALYCYLLEDESRIRIKPSKYYGKWGITEADKESFTINERKFQEKVAGSRMSVAQIRDLLGMKSAVPQSLMPNYFKREEFRRVQVFFDSGKGFSEEESRLFPNAYQNENDVSVNIEVPKETVQLRLDPADTACMVMIRRIEWNGASIPLSSNYIKANGEKINSKCYLFKTDDPNFTVKINNLDNRKHNQLKVDLEVIFLPIEQGIIDKLKHGIKKLLK